LSLQSNDSAEKLPQHPQETLGGGALVTQNTLDLH
jgi:hypothetical protein